MVETKISIYTHAKDNQGDPIPLNIQQIIESIKSDQYKTSTNQYRNILEFADKKTPEGKKAIRDFKEFNFKGVTWSGQFSHRSTAGLVKHSGYICLDIDGRDKFGEVINGLENEEDLKRLRFKLISDEFSFIVFISPSGIGLKIIVKIECSTAEEHKEKYFPLLENYYLDKYNVKIDPSGKNVDRLCFLPYDPDIYVNFESDLFTIHRASIIATETASGGGFRDTIEQIRYCIGELKASGKDITADYDNWKNIGFAFASLGEQGREFFHEVSSLYPAYDAKETNDKFNNFLETKSGKIGIQTFFYHCKNAGVALSKMPASDSPEAIKRKENFKEVYKHAFNTLHEGRDYTDADINFFVSDFQSKDIFIHPDKIRAIFEKVYKEHADERGLNKKPDIVKIEKFLEKNYELFRNEITLRTEGRVKGSNDEFKKINPDSIFRQLQHNASKFPMDKLKSLLKSDFIPTKNPFKEYFNTLPEWDGVDYIGKLADYVIMADDAGAEPGALQRYWKDMFCKALVRSIACAIGGRENRIVMVLVQEEQSTGKSNFIRFLNPFGTRYYTEAPLRDGKDTEFRFSENFIYNLEELSALGALDINKLKAIISKAWIKERKAYAEDEEELPRRCNFWGSTNKAEFLTDTSNTRWLCFKVKTINFSYNNLDTGEAEVNINDVWGQAYHLFKTGYNYNLTAEEAARRDAINKEYEQGSNEKDLIIKFYNPCEKGAGNFLPVVEIEERLISLTNGNFKFNRAALGRALTQLGFISDSRKISGKAARGYWVLKIDPITGASPSVGPGNAPPPPPKDGGQLSIGPEPGDDDDLPF